jgi:NAD(P)-dependent dehydrogenase (short-subunit alcohol dehydrogenase family)
MDIKGITAVITGSTGSLGRHIALSLARAGCNCVCGYHKNHTAAEQLAGEIIELGADAAAKRPPQFCTLNFILPVVPIYSYSTFKLPNMC